jgi:hypothetical protein
MVRAVLASLSTCCLLLSPVLAFDSDLSDTAVREAYFLGQRNDDKTRAFFAPYTKNLPLPKKGAYISEIRLLTPLAQVVQVSSQVTSGYSAQQAQLDYKGRGDSLLLIVQIQFTPSYGVIDADHSANNAAGEKGLTLRREDFWQDFRYGIKQKEDWIEPRSIRGEAQYGSSDGSSGGGLVGAWVYIEYDARNIPSDDTEVHITAPDGQEVTATFDLAKLH